MGTDCKSAAFSFGGSNPPAPTKNSSIFMMLEFLFYRDFAKCSKGGFEQHRPAVQSGWQKSPSGAFLDARLAISTRAHQELQHLRDAGVSVLQRLCKVLQGWIRTAAATALKTAQKQPTGLFLAARLAASTPRPPKERLCRNTRTFFFYKLLL